MAPTLTSINPTSAAPGDSLVLIGTGFAAGAFVGYSGDGNQIDDRAAVVISATELRSTVPDLYFGENGAALVTVIAADGSQSAAATLAISAFPDVETVQPLCGRAAVKRLMGVAPSETYDDARLDRLIRIASAQIASECRRSFGVDTYTELLSGDGTELLQLLHGPIATLSSVTIDGTAAPLSEIKIGTDWIRFEEMDSYNPRIRALRRVFTRGVRNVAVVYTAGYVRIPADISHACELQVQYLLNTVHKQGLLTEANTPAGVTTTYAQLPLAASVKTVCNRYRSQRIGVIA